MNFQELKDFLTIRMKMSHIYQPVMIKKLLINGGKSTDLQIAGELLKFDPSQIEYYQNVTNNMVGKVLKSHAVVTKNKNTFELNGFESLSDHQKSELINICQNKIETYIIKRGDKIWNHRRVNRNVISGTIRYEVLKRAKFHCELCGISADERALEVDHITPITKGGANSIHNYQALCFVCNASKGNRDNSDFRYTLDNFKHKSDSCIFCLIDKNRIVNENNLSYVIKDKYPITSGHCLIIPKRHFQNYFEISQPELNSIQSLLNSCKDQLQKDDKTIEGFNIGINSGEVAGQTIFHTHIHLIPRRKGDINDPTGGVRNIFEGKGKY